MVKRDESLPRVSNLIAFLTEDEFNQIPKNVLEAAAQRGIRNHKVIEDNFHKKTDNVIANMFKDGVKRVMKIKSVYDQYPIFEEQLNGKRYTGRPDFRLGLDLSDYKFSVDLRPVTALQLILYDWLIQELYDICIENHYVFHFPKDYGLFIYKISKNAMLSLRNFARYILDYHESIKVGGMEKYDALIEWEKIQQDYEIFELVDSVLPPLAITNDMQAIEATAIYYNLKAIKDREDSLKRGLKRYMEKNKITFLEDNNGYGIRLQKGRPTIFYDKGQKKIADDIHKKALEFCQIGRQDNHSLVRYKKDVTKQIKED